MFGVLKSSSETRRSLLSQMLMPVHMKYFEEDPYIDWPLPNDDFFIMSFAYKDTAEIETHNTLNGALSLIRKKDADYCLLISRNIYLEIDTISKTVELIVQGTSYRLDRDNAGRPMLSTNPSCSYKPIYKNVAAYYVTDDLGTRFIRVIDLKTLEGVDIESYLNGCIKVDKMFYDIGHPNTTEVKEIVRDIIYRLDNDLDEVYNDCNIVDVLKVVGKEPIYS